MHKYIIYALHLDTSQRIYIGKSSSGLKRPRAHGNTSGKHSWKTEKGKIHRKKLLVASQAPSVITKRNIRFSKWQQSPEGQAHLKKNTHYT